MLSRANLNLRNRWRNIRWFAAVVRSPDSVRHAFDPNTRLAWWWSKVLWLHSKPIRISGSTLNRCDCIADGFRFYGLVYRLLAAVVTASALLCWVGGIAGSFWGFSLLTSGIYLWIVPGLAFSGASEFRESNGRRVWFLVVFLFLVMMFLTSALTAFSIQVRTAEWLPDVANIAITAGMMIFGVGSYLLELAALIANDPKEEASSN